MINLRSISEFLLSAEAFDQLEFYLPQLAHMIIHFEDPAVSKALDRLAVILCQVSLHTALLLSFILKAAIEDYQEENGELRSNLFL
jgi:hypothetical protein